MLIWLIYSPPTQACDNRKECTHDLALISDELVFDQSLSSEDLFGDELEEATRTGKLHPRFHLLLTDTAQNWKTTIGEVEGASNIIKTVPERAPFISWVLLAARMCIITNGSTTG